MRPFFSSSGGVGVTVEAARGRPTAAPCASGFGAGGRRKVAGWAVRVGWTGRKAEAQWEGEGKSAEKKGDWAERTDGPKVTGKILFQIKFDFWIYQGFGNLHKEI
jgi:hypothetical protein